MIHNLILCKIGITYSTGNIEIEQTYRTTILW